MQENLSANQSSRDISPPFVTFFKNLMLVSGPVNVFVFVFCFLWLFLLFCFVSQIFVCDYLVLFSVQYIVKGAHT